MKAKKQTAGERLVKWYRPDSPCPPLARRIDALVRRAVREVWKARGEFDDLLCNDCTGWSRIADRIERKYGVRL